MLACRWTDHNELVHTNRGDEKKQQTAKNILAPLDKRRELLISTHNRSRVQEQVMATRSL